MASIFSSATSISNNDLKRGLKAWCEKREITPTELGMRLGYKNPSTYGWRILRGPGAVTMDCLGRFAIAFGGAAAEELLLLAGAPNDADKRTIRASVAAETAPAEG